MRIIIGKTFQGIGAACLYLFLILGFIASLAVVNQAAGFWGFLIAFVFAPITLAAGPSYALVAWGNPLPLILTYGATCLSWFVQWIGARILSPRFT